jgi:radical SAM superfamily enzyme YgiQ (UPF0313 family)
VEVIDTFGEGEVTTVELLEQLETGRPLDDIDGLAFRKNGEIVENEKSELINNLDTLPLPAWDLLPFENYIQAKSPQGAWRSHFLPILPTRGCAFTCKFCTAPKMWKSIWRTRSPENVVAEMEHFQNTLDVTDFHFEDLPSVSNKSWIVRFCDEIDRRVLKVSWQLPNGTCSESINRNIIKRIKGSGCTNITFAPESGGIRYQTG